jgi:hypothetical protein
MVYRCYVKQDEQRKEERKIMDTDKKVLFVNSSSQKLYLKQE